MSESKFSLPPEFDEEVVGLIDDLTAEGLDEDKAIEAVADFIDTLLPFDVLIAGPVGAQLEEHDGPAIEAGLHAVIDWLKKLVKVDPVARAARQHKRAAKKAERKAKRAARKAEKQRGDA